MGSPFPGMDPWLELYWRDVHARLIIYIADELQHQLPEPLVARAEENVSVDIEGEPAGVVRPDVEVVEQRRQGKGAAVGAFVSAVGVAEPLLLRVPEPEVDRHVAILDPATGDRVITAIEVLSPSNKIPGRARVAYEAKQHDFMAAGVNLVEIDLIRQGQWVFSIDEALLPPAKRTDYAVCVFRAVRPGVRELYPMPMRERLPCLPIPLRPQDRDVVLDLQQVLEQAYDRGRYHRTDYSRPLNPPLSAEDAAWAAELLSKVTGGR